MDIRKYFSVILLAFQIVVSCSQKKHNSTDIVEAIDLDISGGNKSFKLSQLINDNVSITKLETTDKSLIGRIDKLLVVDGYIFVLDVFKSKSIFMFARDGEFLRKIGKNGRGPGEYLFPHDFIIIDKTIFVLDGNSIIKYDFEGNHIETKQLDSFSALKFINIDKETFAFISGGKEDNLIITNNDFEILNSYFPYTNSTVDKLIINPLFKISENGKTIYRKNLNDTLYSINFDGSIFPYKYLNYGDLGISSSASNINEMNDGFQELSNYCRTKLYYEASDSYFVAFSYSDEMWVSVGSGDRQEVFKYSGLINDVVFSNKSYPVGVAENKLVFTVDPLHMKEGVMKASNDNKFYFQMMEFSEGLKSSDNPILLFLKIDFE